MGRRAIPIDIEAISARYISGESSNAIADSIGCDGSVIRDRLVKHGVDVRGTNSRTVGVQEFDATCGLSVADVRACIDYDPGTGIVTRKAHARCRPSDVSRWAGTTPSSKDSRGYLLVRIFGTNCKLHRAVWIWMTGKWPEATIDHINGVKDDNRWINLREASYSQNGMNRGIRSDSSSSFKGVAKNNSGRWYAIIGAYRKQHYLGVFNTEEEAHAAYCAAALILHKEFANFGRVT